ncbi:MAG TPA: GAF domain-containing protein [Candidatus Acidoferrales bacterium]|nr:GAF domain-containing protein [Candidatus Acidoferrales bacterium]
MKASAVSEIDYLVNGWAEGSATLDSNGLSMFAEKLGSIFKVKSDEVAILGLVNGGKFLRFIVPEILQAVGTIPLNSNSALAARTAREKRPEMQNTFAGSRHASVFEGVPMGRGEGVLIQKIMSVPILFEKEVVGVVQVCRKGRTQSQAGADFESGELRTLQGLSETLARFVLLANKD